MVEFNCTYTLIVLNIIIIIIYIFLSHHRS